MARDLFDDDSHRAKELLPQTRRSLFVPRKGVVEIRSGKRPDDHREHLGLPAGDVVHHIAPRCTACSVAFIGIEALVQDHFVFVRDGARFGARILGNGIPDVFDKLKALGNTEAPKVKRGVSSHERELLD